MRYNIISFKTHIYWLVVLDILQPFRTSSVDNLIPQPHQRENDTETNHDDNAALETVAQDSLNRVVGEGDKCWNYCYTYYRNLHIITIKISS